MSSRVVRVGSRGSQLARRQAELVMVQLHLSHPGVEFMLQVIKTSGDGQADLSPPVGEGIFVKELEEALLSGTIDMAVHSLKDVPSLLAPEFALAAVLKREDARDVLVSHTGQRLVQLPMNARVGTGSPRRKAQLSFLRPDLEVFPIRGNVDTRLRKTYSGEVDGVLLAAAALHRLGWVDRITEYLPIEAFLPAVGQGAITLEILASDEEKARLVSPLEDEATRQAVAAERAFLSGLGGGCRAPIAAYGMVSQGTLVLKGMFLPFDGARPLWAQETGPASQAEEVGQSLSQKILSLVRT